MYRDSYVINLIAQIYNYSDSYISVQMVSLLLEASTKINIRFSRPIRASLLNFWVVSTQNQSVLKNVFFRFILRHVRVTRHCVGGGWDTRRSHMSLYTLNIIFTFVKIPYLIIVYRLICAQFNCPNKDGGGSVAFFNILNPHSL